MFNNSVYLSSLYLGNKKNRLETLVQIHKYSGKIAIKMQVKSKLPQENKANFVDQACKKKMHACICFGWRLKALAFTLINQCILI